MSSDRRESLQKLLHTLLITYFQTINALLQPPPAKAALATNAPNDVAKLAEHVRLAAINMHHLLNELRPVQATESLLALKRNEIAVARMRMEELRACVRSVSFCCWHRRKVI